MTDKNEILIKTIFKNLPGEMLVMIKTDKNKILERIKVSDLFDI